VCASTTQLCLKLLLQCEDYKTAYEACHQLMQVNYSAAWVECKALAEAVDFSDVAAKQVVSVFMIFVASLVKSNGSLPPVL